MGSSKPWEDILEEFAGVRTFSAKPCLKYFQPLQEYLEELVAKGELNKGATFNIYLPVSWLIELANLLENIQVVDKQPVKNTLTNYNSA